MKMLNALERAPAEPTPPQRAAVLAEGLSILLRCSSPDHAAHLPRPVARARLRRGHPRTRPGPSPTPAALEQDEIELVLQVNGKLRGNMRVAQGRRPARQIEQLALAHEAVQKLHRRPAGEEDRRRARPAGERGGLSARCCPASMSCAFLAIARAAARCLAGCGFQLRGQAHAAVRDALRRSRRPRRWRSS